ncbi:TmrB-like protein [Streptomyces sp. CB01249]|uniref:AAA family ATPase n=1 Tax=unclassified Streptomyces TaxID=2593676 RepID=UPI00036DB860|nr:MULTISPECIES: AAA family ATPase [unclassified Streptomyces]MYQ76274.1 AAA family ATPase [Streptomyces sp. SID4923]OKJ04297.1 TmrB-like protein [Streptomyces sp. CB01249]
MIIWINGAFGSGKTTLVTELHRRLPEALVFDPEDVGYVLRGIVEVPEGNFQNIPLWRRQVASLAQGLVEEYGRPVLAPMTVVRRQYADEIFGALEKAGVPVHHFFLNVSAPVLEQRLHDRVLLPDDPERDEAARRWGKARIPECVAAVGNLREDTVVLDGELPTDELAALVLERTGLA